MSETIIMILLFIIMFLLIAIFVQNYATTGELMSKVDRKLKSITGLTKKQQKAKQSIFQAIEADMPQVLVQNPKLLQDFPTLNQSLQQNPAGLGILGNEIVMSLIKSAMTGDLPTELLTTRNVAKVAGGFFGSKLIGKLVGSKGSKDKQPSEPNIKPTKTQDTEFVKSSW